MFLLEQSKEIKQNWKAPENLGLRKKMKFSTEDLFSNSDQIHSFLRIWSHLLVKSLMEKFIFCAEWYLRLSNFWLLLPKFYLGNVDWLLDSISTQFWNLFDIS